MRIRLTIFLLLIFISCKQGSDNKSPGEVADSLITQKETGLREDEVHLSEKKNISDLDSIVTDSFIIKFQDAKPFKGTDIYGDLDYRSRLTDSIGNWHHKAEKIQEYLQTKFSNYFTTTDSTLILKLADGRILSFPFWDKEKGEGYTFEHYFKEIDYYLIRVQWVEGNRWLMVNRQNGFRKYINGRPYIKQDKFLAINKDLEAGYSFNGIEFYSLRNEILRNEFSKETTWGPTGIKWVNDSQFLVKREHFHMDSITGQQNNKIDYKLGTIKKRVMR